MLFSQPWPQQIHPFLGMRWGSAALSFVHPSCTVPSFSTLRTMQTDVGVSCVCQRWGTTVEVKLYAFFSNYVSRDATYKQSRKPTLTAIA